MEEFNKLMEENNLPSIDALQDNVIKTASKKEEKKKTKKDTKMRTVNMRISLINVLKAVLWSIFFVTLVAKKYHYVVTN